MQSQENHYALLWWNRQQTKCLSELTPRLNRHNKYLFTVNMLNDCPHTAEKKTADMQAYMRAHTQNNNMLSTVLPGGETDSIRLFTHLSLASLAQYQTV